MWIENYPEVQALWHRADNGRFLIVLRECSDTRVFLLWLPHYGSFAKSLERKEAGVRFCVLTTEHLMYNHVSASVLASIRL